MKAILIDPKARTITEREIRTNADGDADYEALREGVFGVEGSGLIQIVGIGAHHSLVIDEEGMLVDWDSQGFFALGVKPNAATFAGRALIMRDGLDGTLDSCRLPLEFIQATCQWLDAREVEVPAPCLQTVDDAGNVQTEWLAGTPTWNYENRPN